MDGRNPGVASDILIWLSRLGCAYLYIFSILVYFTSIIIVIPSVTDENPLHIGLQWIASSYLFVGLLSNCYMFYKEDSFLSTNVQFKPTTDQDYRSEWKECKICNIMAPPRSHHCILCQRCVQVREHHCFFTGFCVGQRNLKYYLVFCYYCSIGCFYSLYLLLSYVSKFYFSPLSWRLVHFFLPLTFLETIFGFQTWDFFFYILLIYVTLTGCLGSGSAFLWHFNLALIGKTSYEYHRGLPGLDKGYLKNLKLIFGDYWFLNFVVPIPFKYNLQYASVKIV